MPDLITIPGFAELQTITRGDARIKIAVLDGPADLERACFRGANLSRINPFWQQKLEPIDSIYITQQRQINALKDKKKALKKALKQREKAGESNQNQIAPSMTQVTPSNVMRDFQLAQLTHGSVSTVFNALLENTDAPLIEQYRQLSAFKQQKTHFGSTHPPLEPKPSSDINYAAEIAALEAEIEALEDKIPEPVKQRLGGIFHSTGILSLMFGQPGSPVEGVAPNCTAINIPLFETATSDESLSPLNMAHAFNLALELGVNIIHCAACHPTQTGFAHEMIQKAVKQCQDNNILIVAPSGNNKGEWFCAPAILPNVLAVGMMKDNGQPANYSNWGGQYQEQGILAPGENILAAEPGSDEPVRQEGTSLSAPLMTGLAALMMSLQLQRGEQPNAEAVRMAFLNSAIPCDRNEVEEPERCLVGKLNIPGAYQLVTGKPLSNIQPHTGISSPSLVTPSSVTPSAVSNLVYALGSLGYDFGTEARRDTFKQRMPAIDSNGVLVPPNPYDAHQMVNHLELNPAEAKSLIWTLNQELTPIYALEPQKAFANEIYAVFQMLLAGQIQSESNDDCIERVSIPGRLTDRTVELFSGQIVPVLALPNIRGIYGWQINSLVAAAVTTVRSEASEPDIVAMRRSLKSFLHRIYFDLQNLGQLDRDRALNFAATNAFQAASTFAEAIASGMELDSIEVEKSPFCRLNSNCWDIKLKFFDSENSSRAKKVYRFTIDVANIMPVTLGTVRSWSVPR